MLIELYEDVKKLEEIKSVCFGYSRSTIQSHIQDLINEKNKQIAKIQDEHNRRSLEDLLGRKI